MTCDLRDKLILIACAAMLVLFAVLASSAASTKGPTYDEPLHVIGAYVQRMRGDYRVNPEDPALFGYYTSLAADPNALKASDYTQLRSWQLMLDNFVSWHWEFATTVLFRTPGVNGDAMIRRARPLFVLVGFALGALIASWAWQLGGAWAALVATGLYAFDPNFIGHSALVKNDVMFSLLLTALAMSIWRFGRRGTWASLLAILLIIAAAFNVKFSALLMAPITLILLAYRAWLPNPWTIMGKTLGKPVQRLCISLATCGAAVVVTFIAIWAIYGLRYAPSNEPGVYLNTHRQELLTKTNKARLVSNPPTREQILDQPAGALADAVVWTDAHHILPQAWLNGLLYTYASSIFRTAFLMDSLSNTGWWYYFPLAMLFKTPLATLVILFGALVLGIRELVIRRGRLTVEARWTLACLLVPFAIYMASAMATNLNLGLRHVLPVYPIMYITAGVLIGRALREWHKPVVQLLSLLGLLLVVETLLNWPNYIAFFNFACDGPRGGLALLGDSNLDWGQDLPLLAEWQKQHPDVPLAFGPIYTDPGGGSYAGSADPKFYGIVSAPLPPGAPSDELKRSHILAVSATMLQDIHLRGYGQYRQYKPLAVLGGTIYLYDLRKQP